MDATQVSGHCPNCGKVTPQKVYPRGQFIACSMHKTKCDECGWYAIGLDENPDREWQPPDADLEWILESDLFNWEVYGQYE